MHLMTDPPTPGRRTPDPLTHIAIICVVVAGLLLLFAALAHAAGATPQQPTGIDWNFWLAVAGATLGGLSVVLHVVAPRTANTWDDRLRDDVDEVLTWYRDQRPSPVKLAPGPGSGTAAMLAILLLGALAAPATGCATGRTAIAEGAVAFLECEDVHVDAKLESDLKLYAESLPRKWLAGGVANLDAIKADIAPIKSDALRCLVAGALVAATALVSPTPGTAISALSSSTAAPAAVRAQFEIAARLAGWPAVRLPGGEVL